MFTHEIRGGLMDGPDEMTPLDHYSTGGWLPSHLLKMLRRRESIQKARNALMSSMPILLQSLLSPKHHQLQQPPSVAMHQAPDHLEAAYQQKRALRSKVRKDLKGMSPTQRRDEDIAIQNIVLEASWFKASTGLCAYISCDALREVDTSRILSEVLSGPTNGEECHIQTKKKLYVPRVEDKNSHMRMLNISSMEDLIANSMNILEPAPVDSEGNERQDVMLATHPVDLLLLPGLAFNRSGRRLGRGGGYYDTFLRKYEALATERKWKQPLRVALSYSLQILDEEVIPITPNDVPVDALVSPTGVIRISPAALERM